MVAVAAIAQAVIPSINWAEGFVLGAIVAPTDPVSAIATFQRVGVTDRVATLVEGESMINDAVALVSYKVALAAVVTGTLTAGEAIDDLVVGVIGGVAIGLAVSAWPMALRSLDDASRPRAAASVPARHRESRASYLAVSLFLARRMIPHDVQWRPGGLRRKASGRRTCGPVAQTPVAREATRNVAGPSDTAIPRHARKVPAVMSNATRRFSNRSPSGTKRNRLRP